MTTRIVTSTDVKTVTPITNPTFVKTKTSTNSETATALKAGDVLKIDAASKAAAIDFSSSTVDNIIDASASATVKAITGGKGYDIIIGSTIKSTLTAGTGGADITGGAADDKLIGVAGDDNLNGGLGKNTLTGGAGNNTFFSYGTDKITDLTTGDDLYVGSTGIATATVTGDFIAGSASANDGVAVISNAAGKLVDLSHAGIGAHGFKVDAAKASVATLIGGVNADSLIGGAGDDSITAGKGNTITGGKGADTFTFLAGTTNNITDLGVGSDVLKVAATAVVNATAAKGFDVTTATVIDGTANITGAKTLDLSDATGSGSIVLTGSAGKDILKGGAVAIELRGGDADDTYYVNNIVDLVIEESGKGTDTVSSSINYTLTANVDNLILTGTATTATGNDLVNKITANDTADSTIDGGAGADSLVGGSKNDTFIVDNIGDSVVDKKGGIDLVLSSVSFDLSKSAAIENLTLTGAADINGTGNKLANIIIGNDGKNALTGGKGDATINGGAGDDTLTVGLGKNELTGGDGADTFIFIKKAGVTTITDFVTGTDKLQISAAAVKGLVAGAVADTAFVSNTTGLSDTTAHKFIYNSSTGGLYFDADGSAAKSAAVLIETIGVSSHPALAAADITIIA